MIKIVQLCGILYQLNDLDKGCLGAFVKKYGQDWVGAIEKEERSF